MRGNVSNSRASLSYVVGARTTQTISGPPEVTLTHVVSRRRASAPPTFSATLGSDEARVSLLRHLPAATADVLIEFLADADGGDSPATDMTERVLGCPLLTFRAWAQGGVAVSMVIPAAALTLNALAHGLEHRRVR